MEQLEYEDVVAALDFALGRCFEDEVQTRDEEAGGGDEDLEFLDRCYRVGPFEPEDAAGRLDLRFGYCLPAWRHRSSADNVVAVVRKRDEEVLGSVSCSSQSWRSVDESDL